MNSQVKKKIISALLTVAVLATSAVIPASSKNVEAESRTEINAYGGMVLSKTVSTTDIETRFKITLGAYSTGEGTEIETTVSKPVDIVVIVDQSGSMDFKLGSDSNAGSGEDSRLDVLQTALNSFITSVKKDASDNNVNHRMAIVGYSETEGTEILIGSNHYNYSNTSYSSKVTTGTSYVAYSGKTNSGYYDYKDSLYAVADGSSEYQKVTVSNSGTLGRDFTYTIGTNTFTSSGWYSSPTFTGYTIYRLSTVTERSLASTVYGSALQDVTTSAGATNISASVNELDAYGGTYPANAATMTKGIFDAYADDYKDGNRLKVVVFFTDGYVGSSSSDNFNTTEANSTLATLKEIKDGGATVFTVGLFSSAVTDTADNLPSGSNVSSTSGKTNCRNRFLYLASSFYPKATSMDTTGSICDNFNDKDFYMSPTTSDGLTAAFAKITTYIHKEFTTVDFTEKVQLRDVITPYFVGPTDTSQITAYFLNCTGVDPEDDTYCLFDETNKITPGAGELTIEIKSYEETETDITVGDIPNDTVIATDFDYKENWCGDNAGTPHGKKLVLEFYVDVRDGFLGGNDVPTNQEISGLYDENGKRMEGFEFPLPEEQDVPVQPFSIQVDSLTKHVYLYGSLTEDQMDLGATVQVIKDGGELGDLLKLDEVNYGIPAWKSEFVTLTSSVNVAMPKTNITEDFTYKMTAELKANSGDQTNKASDESDETDVLVYVPRITTQDISVSAGETPDYTTAIAGVDWVHYNSESKAWETYDKMMGVEPTLQYEFSPVASATYGETHVKITKVLMDVNNDGTFETDITSRCLFEHDECAVEGCAYNAANDSFMVHVTNALANIVIQNTGETVDGNDTFVYYVTKAGDSSYKQTVIIKGTNQKVILSVPVGTYTVKQDTAWSYNYTCETDATQTMLLQGERLEDRNNVFTFENSKNAEDYNRDAWGYVKNIFNSASEIIATN